METRVGLAAVALRSHSTLQTELSINGIMGAPHCLQGMRPHSRSPPTQQWVETDGLVCYYPSMAQTLVIVDMQPEFLQRVQDSESVVRACLQEVSRAQQYNEPVVFLEIRNGCCCRECLVEPGLNHIPIRPTLPELRAAAGLHYLKVKHANDGSGHVKEVVSLERLPESFLVMGVNTDACVLATVRGLRKLYPSAPIEVVSEGCGSSVGHQWGLTRIAALLGEGAIRGGSDPRAS